MTEAAALPRARPSARGVDPRALLAFLDAVEADPGVELHSLLLAKGGVVVAEGYAAPYLASDAPLVYSVSKTFTASAVAVAIGEGRLALADRVVDLLPGDVPDDVDPRVEQVTVHHLLSMSTGHDQDTLDRLVRAPEPEWSRVWMGLGPAGAVGSRHVYDNGASWLLGEIVRVVTGESLVGYLRPRLLDPIGVEVEWTADRLGREQGFSGVHVTTEGIARLAELWRRDGVWEGRRLLPEGWVHRASTAQVATAAEGAPAGEVDPDWSLGYGYQVWRSRHGYRLDGAKGQFGLVIPELDTVVAITSLQSPAQRLLDHVWDHVVPGLSAASPPDQGADDELADRLARLQVPPPGRSTSPEQTRSPVERVRLTVDETSADAAWSVELTSEGRTHRLSHSGPQWQRHELTLDEGIVALGSSVREREGRVDLALVFLSTPHVLEVSAPVDGGRSGVADRTAWREAPLWESRLSHFAIPRGTGAGEVRSGS